MSFETWWVAAGNAASDGHRAGLCLCFMTELLTRPVITLFARVCLLFLLSHKRRDKGYNRLNYFCSFQRCRGTTKQQLMVTWTSWRRPQGNTWTLRMMTAWLPPCWLLFMDTSMHFSSYAADSKHSTSSRLRKTEIILMLDQPGFINVWFLMIDLH